MNKKQLIIAWSITVILCLVVLFTPKKYTRSFSNSIIAMSEPWKDGGPPTRGDIPKIQWDFVLQRSLTVLLIGGMLVYTFRNKK